MTTTIKTTNISTNSITTALLADGAVTANKLGSISIDALNDVNTTSIAPTEGQTLVWSTATSNWIPGTTTGGSDISPFMLAGM